jgi:DNA-binding transcriptional MerR regulator
MIGKQLDLFGGPPKPPKQITIEEDPETVENEVSDTTPEENTEVENIVSEPIEPVEVFLPEIQEIGETIHVQMPEKPMDPEVEISDLELEVLSDDAVYALENEVIEPDIEGASEGIPVNELQDVSQVPHMETLSSEKEMEPENENLIGETKAVVNFEGDEDMDAKNENELEAEPDIETEVEETPTETEEISSETEETPTETAPTGGTPTETETPTGGTPTETEEAPTEAEEAPTETEAEETPTETEETPTEAEETQTKDREAHPELAEAHIEVEETQTAVADEAYAESSGDHVGESPLEDGGLNIPADQALYSRQYYTMRETAAMFSVNQSLLRFWENEFDILKPKKNRKGDRYFRPDDIKNLELIYHLLKVRKFTIGGAKDYLKSRARSLDTFEMVQRLEKIKHFLLELKTHL